jgi:hypothetical protein
VEAFQQNQETALADTDQAKVRFLGQRDEMQAAITNFNEGQGSMILNKDHPFEH